MDKKKLIKVLDFLGDLIDSEVVVTRPVNKDKLEEVFSLSKSENHANENTKVDYSNFKSKNILSEVDLDSLIKKQNDSDLKFINGVKDGMPFTEVVEKLKNDKTKSEKPPKTSDIFKVNKDRILEVIDKIENHANPLNDEIAKDNISSSQFKNLLNRILDSKVNDSLFILSDFFRDFKIMETSQQHKIRVKSKIIMDTINSLSNKNFLDKEYINKIRVEELEIKKQLSSTLDIFENTKIDYSNFKSKNILSEVDLDSLIKKQNDSYLKLINESDLVVKPITNEKGDLGLKLDLKEDVITNKKDSKKLD